MARFNISLQSFGYLFDNWLCPYTVIKLTRHRGESAIIKAVPPDGTLPLHWLSPPRLSKQDTRVLNFCVNGKSVRAFPA